MTKIKNITLKKEIKKQNNSLYIFIIFLVLGALFIAFGIYENRKNEANYDYLNNVIENKNNETGTYAYLNVAQAPYSIAKYEDEDNEAFYIIFDGTYFYIAYLSDDLYTKLNVEGLEEDPLTIYGITTATPEDVKEIAIEVYNEGLKEEDQISMDNFNNYFGEVYLNNTSLKKLNSSFYLLSIIPFSISLIFLIIFATKKIKTKRILSTLTEEELTTLEQELESTDTNYYSNYHLILTPNYLISFTNGLNILKYNNLIWVYEHKVKQYGITTAKNIFVMDNKGKTYHILSTDAFKKSSELIKEITTNISNKNENMLVGYNKRNQEEINEILKNS